MSRVWRLCPVFRTQPGAYPPETQNRTLRHRAGEQKIRPKPSASGSVERGNAATVENTETGKIGGFWTLRRKRSRIKGWRRKRRRSRHFCPQCGQLPRFSTQSVVAPFVRDFRAAGVLVPASAGVPRILVVPYSCFGELWVRKTWRTLHTGSGAGRAYFAPL